MLQRQSRDESQAHFFDALRLQQESQERMLRMVIDSQASQTMLMQEFISLWKPSPTKSNGAMSLDERMHAKDLAASAAWEPIGEDVFAMLDRDLDIPKEFLV